MKDGFALCYHAVSDDWPAALTVRHDDFHAQIARVAQADFQAVGFTDLATGTADVPRAVAITFDDAYTSVIEHALPVLSEFAMTATVFVAADYPDTGEPMAWTGNDHWPAQGWAGELSCMSWDQLRELAAAGWEIGSHTCSHPRLTACGDEALRQELVRSREVIGDRIGVECTSIAYPYGNLDGRVARAAADAGYAAGGALEGRFATNSPLTFPRVGIYRGDGPRAFAVKTARPTRRLRSTPAWDLLERVRSTRRG